MEAKINVAEILKDKPQGTKLWSPISGDCKYEYLIHDSINVWFQGLGVIMLSKKGKWNPCGETIIFPSKQMQDWSKFAWKKGDVLESDNKLKRCIFEEWANDDYTDFNCFAMDEGWNDYFSKINNSTSEYHKADDYVTELHIKRVEKKFGGKLNLETLEIEQPKREFKDGDIVTLKIPNLEKNIRIFKEVVNKKMHENHYYVGFNFDDDGRPIQIFKDYYAYTDNDRPATDSEKQQLFSALAKEGKRWNPDTKQIEDLPKKYELKPFDKVLAKIAGHTWTADFFSHYDENDEELPYVCIWYGRVTHCIPYNDETKHLLGTTDEWKGGE